MIKALCEELLNIKVVKLHEVIIPKVGMGITEVEISKWEVKIGDKINEGDPIVEINTERRAPFLMQILQAK